MNTIVHSSLPALPGVRGALQRVVSGLHWLRIAHAERRRRRVRARNSASSTSTRCAISA